ncbi:type VI secretion system baseplate subunit TssE [Legionella yabuuchiae]|uniref:type VI secretion system baseplate subunit TssE n=1 Tax=Legionella yabuuchiae TaxID=376727 RepID=UPI001056E0B0|nr:type VI secretion system baseplate subunit TssE [Legionella yabuuchiae]
MTDLIHRLLGKPCSIEESILSHIQYLLNTRQGSLIHMPDYGLSEYPVHQVFAETQKRFIDDLKTLIERFEPRVNSLTVIEIKNDVQHCVLQVSLQADLMQKNAINFEARLLNNGAIKIGNE